MPFSTSTSFSFLFKKQKNKLTKSQIPLFRSDVHDLSEGSLDVPATCSGTSNTQQSNTTLNPKEDFKEVLLLMSLRANRVYRYAHGSQVSFKHQTGLKALHNFPEKASVWAAFLLESAGFILWFNLGSFTLYFAWVSVSVSYHFLNSWNFSFVGNFFTLQHFCFTCHLSYFRLLTIFLWLLRQKVQMCFGWADWSDPRVGEELTWKNGGEGAWHGCPSWSPSPRSKTFPRWLM